MPMNKFYDWGLTTMSKKTTVSCPAAVPFVNVKLGDADNFPALPAQAVQPWANHVCVHLIQEGIMQPQKGALKLSTFKIKILWWQWWKKPPVCSKQCIWSVLQVTGDLKAICGTTPLTPINQDQTCFVHLCGLTPLNSLVKLCQGGREALRFAISFYVGLYRKQNRVNSWWELCSFCHSFRDVRSKLRCVF